MTDFHNLASAVAAFGKAAAQKLANRAISGAPEDQLRTPMHDLVRDLAQLIGIPSDALTLVGETSLSDLATRPDFGVTVWNALVGFVEIKAPGKGADPRRFTDEHDKRQWAKLRTLPNLIYSDGNSFSLWQNGELQGSVVQLEGNVETFGSALAAPPALLTLFSDFLHWQPIPPRTAKKLAETSARLCRLLREEVAEALRHGNPGLTSLAGEWRILLFPEATDAQFADGYAQAVTFGLLVARVRNVDLSPGLDAAANELRKSSTLIGTALRLLIDNPDIKRALQTSLGTLTRVLNVVDWPAITKSDAGAWLYFYEDFLEVYDNDLRKKTGSYYTPPEVVNAMVRLTDEALRDPTLFNRPAGLAAPSVTICDPATGTGTFLLGVLRRIAETVAQDQGPGAVGPAIVAATQRILGFELQFGPFAVAQLRLIAELQSLIGDASGADLPSPRLYVTDTLGDPYAAETQFSAMVAPIGESRKEANRIKRETPITVVIGNPPYKNQAGGLGGWIENGSKGREKPMARWTPPAGWGIGVHAHHLKNMYIYFWRWATLKVFGSGWAAVTGEVEKERSGIVCFITAAGFLNGPGFQKMREELRRDCAAIWVIDCSPEGHQPDVATRIFQGVQQTICIVLAGRIPNKDRDIPACLKYTVLPSGNREGPKFAALAALSLMSFEWKCGPTGWREPFLPEQEGIWPTFPALGDFFFWSGPGVKTHRTWTIAPDAQSLDMRWTALQLEIDPNRKETLFHPDRDRNIQKIINSDLGSYATPRISVANDKAGIAPPVRYAFRSFDRQWLPPDSRLLSQPRPELWAGYSEEQVYLTALEAHSPTSGPSVTFAGLIPDNHHYKGSFAGRVYPLWRNAAATVPNVKPALLAYLSSVFGWKVRPEDMMAYLAALMAHPAFTTRFKDDLVRPGLRVPISADAKLFSKAAALGREVIWLHTYGERFADPAQGRPAAPPRLPKDKAPFIPKDGTIPGAPEPLPDTMNYDAAKRRLHIGKGHIDNVPPEVWAYEVSGMNVLRQWFSYRKRDRKRPIIGDRRPPSPLSDIQPDHWPHEYTNDLIDLLNVLGRLVALEPNQAALLEEVLAHPLIDRASLELAGALASDPATPA